MAASPELRLPRAETVDISRDGVLLAFDEPVGFPLMHRLVITLKLPDGHFHALGHVSRVERGDDFRTYVALSLDDVSAEEFDELISHIDSNDDARDRAEVADDHG